MHNTTRPTAARISGPRPRTLSVLLPIAVLLLFAGAGCDDRDRPIPFDPRVVTGRLENGLVYYVRQNPKPKARLELRLIVRAGSILEDDDQQGLAHVLEHMAFNGTANFDRQQLVDYLESIGMRFGPDLNAYTSFDETVYRLQVPTTDERMIENGFRILRDWAFGILNRDDEIEKERGVVIEEWRLGRGAAQRIRDRHFPVLFQGARYARRLPIGTRETLDTFPPERVRDFCRDWYRPDLMALIAVGDMEATALVAQIEKHFAGARPPEAPRERTASPVPGHAETLVSVVTDKEATQSSISVCFKRSARIVTTAGDYRAAMTEALFFHMLNQRLDELRQKADAPFLQAGLSKWSVGNAGEIVTLGAQVRDNGFLPGLEAALTEAHRARRHGFAAAELERAGNEMMTRVEKAYNERETTESGAFVRDYADSFLHGNVVPGIEAERQLHRRLLPGIDIREVNRLAAEWLADSNRVILASGPEKAGVTMPSREELLAALERVDKTELSPYRDDVGTGSLVEEAPAPGSVVSRSEISELGVTVWRLSNGATVMLKPTTFKKDQIVFTAFAPGGHSLASDADWIPAASADAIMAESGWGNYSRIQLRKTLAGKVVSHHPFIGELRQGVRGSTRPEDLETALQLIHLAFTAPRRDPDAFQAYRERKRTELANRLARPEQVFADEVQVTMYANHMRRRPWTVETVDKLDLDRSLAVYAERFRSADGFVFLFVGNLDLPQIEDLVNRYIGSLPAPGRAETWKDHGIRPVRGPVERTVRNGQDPKSRVLILFSGDLEWSIPERYRLQSMLNVLKIRLREKIREEISGTYGVSVSAGSDRYPVASYQVRISFGCAPDRVEGLIQAVHAEIEWLKTTPVDDVYLTKVKQTDLREREVALEKNEFWLGVLDSCQWNGDDPRAAILEFPKFVESLTREDIAKAARTYLGTEDIATFILKPESPAGN